MKYALRFPPLLLLALIVACSARDDGSKQALLNCMSSIQSVTGDAGSTKVPYAKDFGSGNEHYFAWPEGSGLTLPERYGSSQPASASCITDAAGVVTGVTINGSEIPIR